MGKMEKMRETTNSAQLTEMPPELQLWGLLFRHMAFTVFLSDGQES